MKNAKIVSGILARLLVIVIVTVFLSQGIALLSAITLGVTGFETMAVGPDFFLSLIYSSVAVIPAVFIVYTMFKDDFSMGWKENRLMTKGVEGSVWGIFLITVPFLFVWLLGGVRVANVSFNSEVLKNIGLGIILFLLVAISEELLLRGYLQGILKKHFGVKAAIIAGSLLFSLLHIGNPDIMQNPIPLIVLFIAGILFGVSREVTGGLWVPIGIHFTWNLFQGHIYGFEVSGMDFSPAVIEIERTGHQLVSGGNFGLEGSLITLLFLIGAVYLHWRYYNGRRSDEYAEQ
ncbi:type II CAAX endopeptidase family protein [Chitinispirillales bacterium ANBcel5]|uniref:CPBP family intramembrane glutamic endopeptidase n=1 Tax=Cellulosispirillum alkaliphilum TaxID=3039283 RepID=UPI002A556463|nr:type II CAAX endopeptidase family protein [Chitinispirillales bacterium ANBcel5]